ncbi:hypothetical protein B566_EDAN014288 [Ephemera danica]|nr:hypothetical protein B566_EDAN014288 [Ephemera danica]
MKTPIHQPEFSGLLTRKCCRKRSSQQIQIIRYNTYNIFTTKEFLSCSATRIEEILKDRKLHVSELDLFQACVKWSNANEVESRRKALSSSLHCIDFRKFSVEEFATYVSPTRLLSPENERDIFRSLVTGKNFLPKRFSDMP